MNHTTTWQEDLARMIEDLPEDNQQRAHDFLVGYLAAMKEEVTTNEEDQA